MRLRDTIISLLCVAVSFSLLFAASTRLDPINKTREDLNLVSNTALENAPPSLAFATIAMGAFRGLVVDILWIRADNLKEEGQFFDAKQLAEWITTLQPRFAQVWDFQAWNMAYNISVAMPASQWEERWKWVRNGYELLRDKGIKNNPKSMLLYRSLAWIFQHKMGGVTDDCHKHYKRELALSMRQLLGYPLSNEEFEKLAASPKELKLLLEDPKVAEFIELLMKSDKELESKSELVNNYLALRQTPDKFSEEAGGIIKSFEDTVVLDKFDTFARAKTIEDTWAMDLDMMIEINKNYGPRSLVDPNSYEPLNWEHPNAHAIFWAIKGLDIAGKEGEYRVGEKNTDRIVFHGLQDLFRLGKMIIYPIPDGPDSVFLRPDLKMYDVTAQAWRDVIDKYEAFEKGNPKGLRSGYKNFMINGLALFYQAGHKKKAGEIYIELRERYPLEEFNIPLATFVKKRMSEEISDIDYKDATELIIMALHEAYFRFAVYDDDAAAAREDWAKQLHELYVKEFSDEEVLRIDLPSFERMRYLSLLEFLYDEMYPQNLRQNLMNRIAADRPDLREKMEKQQQLLQDEIDRRQKQQGDK